MKQLAKLLQDVTVPKARASIVWVLGEYHQHVPLIAPDVLRVLAKSFTDEDELVKLQTLNLGTKLFLTNPAQTKEIFKHVLEMAKYDLNYDIRDKARLMRCILFSSASPTFAQHAQRLFITTKPAPTTSNEDSKGSDYALGSLSHIVGHKTVGYLVQRFLLLFCFIKSTSLKWHPIAQPIPDFPEVPPDTDRTPEDAIHAMEAAPAPVLGYSSGSSSDTDGSWSYSDSDSDAYSYTDTESDSGIPNTLNLSASSSAHFLSVGSRSSRTRSQSSSRSRSASDSESDSYTDSYSGESQSDESECVPAFITYATRVGSHVPCTK